MAIICDICKKEVHLVSFGRGFVGVCCNKVLYSFADKSQLDMKQDEKKDILFTRSLQKEGLIEQNIPDRERREYNEPNKSK